MFFKVLNNACHNWTKWDPQQSLFHHTLCCIKFSDINFDSWVRVKLFFLTSHHCSKCCHTQGISRAVLILSWNLSFVSLLSNLTGMTHKTQGWGWCREDAGQLPTVRKGKLVSSHPSPPHCKLLSDHAQVSCTKTTPIFFHGLSKSFPFLLLQRTQWTYSHFYAYDLIVVPQRMALKWAIPHLTGLKPALWCDRRWEPYRTYKTRLRLLTVQYEHCKTTSALIDFNFIRLQLELGIFPFCHGRIHMRRRRILPDHKALKLEEAFLFQKPDF